MNLQSILKRNRSDIALVIGNGINKYGSAPTTNSWHDLLLSLWKRFLGPGHRTIPTGIALTEFYDLLELKTGPSVSGKSLQEEFCNLMHEWTPHEHHKRIVSWAQKAKSPVLTTNFEKVLGEAGGCTLFHTARAGFTDYYPWETYYANKSIDDPSVGFGIWHINGMEHYHRSIRLGLTHFMGSVERARGWIHKGNERKLFSGKNVRDWEGARTWLHVVFNKPLLFFGLGLEENEVFLRWLLIERARYFREFPEREKSAWYLHTDEVDGSGKLFFLESIGVKPVRAESYDEIYGAATWG